MQSRISLKLILLIAVTAFFSIAILLMSIKPALFETNTVSENSGFVEQAISAAVAASSKLPVSPTGVPIHLKIPNINVDASIVSVGITPYGAMEAPVGPLNVGWFKFGSIPGEVGSAVMAGHYGHWKMGGGSVFDNLSKLKKGDKIYVENDVGVVTTFVVRKFRTYGKDEDAADVFSSSDGKAHLNLVTCEGIWDSKEKTYSNRFVVFADKLY